MNAAHHQPLFELNNRRLEYQGKTVLDNLSLTYYRGERVALVVAVARANQHCLKHCANSLTQQVAWCPQQPGLVPMLSAFHNIYMGALDRH